jgi:hypothetical protein
MENPCRISVNSQMMINSLKTSTAALSMLIAIFLISLSCRTANSTNPSNQFQSGSQVATSPPATVRKEIAQQSASSDKPSVFAPILQSLQAKTKVPLRLPGYLATENETHALYAIVESASVLGYEIQLAFSEDCSGGNVCHYGIVSGRAIGTKVNRPKGEKVPLANGLTGYFVDATCGATCSDSTLTWDQGGFRYTVGLKAEKLDTVKKVAESAIAK